MRTMPWPIQAIQVQGVLPLKCSPPSVDEGDGGPRGRVKATMHEADRKATTAFPPGLELSRLVGARRTMDSLLREHQAIGRWRPVLRGRETSERCRPEPEGQDGDAKTVQKGGSRPETGRLGKERRRRKTYFEAIPATTPPCLGPRWPHEGWRDASVVDSWPWNPGANEHRLKQAPLTKPLTVLGRLRQSPTSALRWRTCRL